MNLLKTTLTTILGGVFFSSTLQAQSFTLPIWKEEVEALGYKLPKPIGFNISYMSVKQNFAVNSIGFSGLNLQNMPVLDVIPPTIKLPGIIKPLLKNKTVSVKSIDMQAHEGTQNTDVFTARADVWLFPFLNLYALAGKVKGDSTTSVDYTVAIDPLKIPLFGEIKIPDQKGQIKNFSLKLDGNLYGAGIVLAGGYKNIFTLVDASYTKTNLTVIDGSIDAFVVSPRIGYDFHSLNVPLRVWAGAMYQNVEQNLSGSIGNLDLGAALANLPANFTKDAKFHVKQHLTTKWNPLLGMQYEFHPNFNILAEVGLGERRSAFVTLDLRY